MFSFKKSKKLPAKHILVRKVDNHIITVIGEEMLDRKIFEHEDDTIYDEIIFEADKIRTDKLTPSQEAAAMQKIRQLMSAKAAIQQEETIARLKDVSEESRNLAMGDDQDAEERKVDAARITAICPEMEHDMDGLVYLKGHSVPMPRNLVKAMVDALNNPESNYTFESLDAFWKWAVLNPNQEARKDLFGWFDTGKFTITEEGMIVAYRCVDIFQEGFNYKLHDFVNYEVAVIKSMKKSIRHYGVCGVDQDKDGNYDRYERFVLATNPNKVDSEHFLGSVEDLYSEFTNEERKMEESGETIFTDHHSGTMRIKMGQEVYMNRSDCDENSQQSCSRGLHFMSERYSLRYGEVTIMVLINPMNIVAFPSYDNTKGRCCRYLPVAKAMINEDTRKLETFDEGTFEFSYASYTRERLENHIAKNGFNSLVESGEISGEVKATDLTFFREEIREKVAKRKSILT